MQYEVQKIVERTNEDVYPQIQQFLEQGYEFAGKIDYAYWFRRGQMVEEKDASVSQLG